MSRTLLFTLLVTCPLIIYSSEVKIDIEGLNGELKKNVDLRLSTVEDQLDDNGFRSKFVVTREIKNALKAKGYYNPEIKFDDTQDNHTLKAHVDAGDPIIVSAINYNITGEGQQDDDYILLAKAYQEQVGQILDHGIYDSLKKRLMSIALRKGYFDSHLSRSELGVSPVLKKSIWNIDFNSAERYKFGQIRFHNSQIFERYLQNIVPFEEGEYYTSEKLAELNNKLSATNWFKSISVAPDFDEVSNDKQLPFDVVLAPRKQNSVELGLGYSTGVGTKARVSWKKPWVNKRGHSFDSVLSVSQYEQELSVGYKMPLSKSPLEHYYLLNSSFIREDYNDTESDSISVNLTHHWDFEQSWKRAIGLTMTYDRFTQANISNKTFLFYPTVMISRMRSDGKLMPMWGDYQQYSIDVASKVLFSDISFWAFQAQNTWIRSLTPDNHRVILRGMYGYIHADDFLKVPPSMRYFAGGDRSIRGYSYKSISPKDSEGKLIGAERLATGSIEYQYNVTGPWWLASFVDVGQATNKFSRHNIKSGAGLGVRWASPVGPVKLDIAIPTATHRKSVHFYIGLGPEL